MLQGKLCTVHALEQKMIKPWWMLFSLWGVDVSVVALCWGVLIAALFGISLLTFGPLLLLFGVVWSYTLTTRALRALLGREMLFAEYYRGHVFPMLIVAFCVLLSTLWLLFFYVGQYLIAFFTLPLLFILAAHAPILKTMPHYKDLMQATAFVFACAVPAYYYGYLYAPLQMILNSHLWCLVCLFLLFNVERNKPLDGQAGEKAAIWVQTGLLILFVPSAYMALTGDTGIYDHQFYGTICIAAASLHYLSKWRHAMSAPVWFSLCWPGIGIPALLGILLFAPETWF